MSTTTVAAVLARSWPVAFDDLDVVLVSRSWDKPTGVTTLVFDGDLEPVTVAAIRDRITSRDDADQAARDALRADRDALDEADPWRRLYDYVLGD